jgi:cytochrome c oxidase subunit 3|tara:strand:- start:280 stop:414 length:135 start_codon:yes stop_codon:yes gene_type:complete
MILFIVSEVMFFFGLFWAFFHSSLSPNIEIGAVWPPKGIIPFDP